MKDSFAFRKGISFGIMTEAFIWKNPIRLFYSWVLIKAYSAGAGSSGSFIQSGGWHIMKQCL